MVDLKPEDAAAARPPQADLVGRSYLRGRICFVVWLRIGGSADPEVTSRAWSRGGVKGHGCVGQCGGERGSHSTGAGAQEGLS